MNIPVTLARHSTAWWFRDSAVLSGWLACRPWHASGAVRVVRLTSPAMVEETKVALRHAIRAEDDGAAAQLAILSVDAPADEEALLITLLDALGLARRQPRKVALKEVVRELGYRQTIIIVDATTNAHTSIVDSLLEIVDYCSKAAQGTTATFLVLDTAQLPVVSQADDFTVGMPLENVLDKLGGSDHVLWPAYVHARLAWDSGGNIPRAIELNERGADGLLVGDDEGLERVLNAGATGWFDRLVPDVKRALAPYFARMRSEAQDSAITNQLLAAGVLWRPPGETRARPTPWLARGLLLRGTPHDMGMLLRACIICAPLARGALGRAFDIEAHERAALSTTLRRGAEPDVAQDRYRNFLARDARSEVAYYPPGCPAVPRDAWAFATFGQLLSAVPQGDRRQQARHALRELRNVLAHGHVVGWRLLLELRDVESRLGAR